MEVRKIEDLSFDGVQSFITNQIQVAESDCISEFWEEIDALFSASEDQPLYQTIDEIREHIEDIVDKAPYISDEEDYQALNETEKAQADLAEYAEKVLKLYF